MKTHSTQTASPQENPPGITRRTLSYNHELMLCHFQMKAGAQIPLHNHRPSQIGYVISGKVRFIGKQDADAFEVGAGDSYVFDPEKHHGAQVLEDAELIECFSPSRQEYQDGLPNDSRSAQSNKA